MKTRESIIENLLDKKYITVKEAVILLKDMSNIYKGEIRYVGPPNNTTLPWIDISRPPTTISPTTFPTTFPITSDSTVLNTMPNHSKTGTTIDCNQVPPGSTWTTQ